ncbi:MAG: hypothetical protein QOE70_6446 [Chthoniobacter sp.]|jgi:hypothetical protein|nr:hypothetical protein [Chthoniobacter sp.]
MPPSNESIRRLIWLYFWLLIFEGVLRKWVVPSLSSVLLLARDPVVIAIYFLALRQGIFPLNRAVAALALLCVGAFTTGLFAAHGSLMVTLYGLRANFLHLPLIFIMAEVLTRADVERVGKAMLVLAIPMAVLMVLQFRAAPDALLNTVAGGGDAEQLHGAMGKIRPPGFFSFITGAAQFLALLSAFVFYGLVNRRFISPLLLSAAAFALVLSLAVSTSRLAVGSVAFVAAGLVVICGMDRRLIPHVGRAVAVIAALILVASALSYFREGVEVFAMRANETGDSDMSVGAAGQGLAMRWFSDISGGLDLLAGTPLLGWGIGLGTNVGAQFTTGTLGFLLAESEWSRVILETGPILGLAYLAVRVAIAGWMFFLGLRGAQVGQPLPLLLSGASGLLWINGQFGQPTTLGFAVFGAGLALAALRLPEAGEEPDEIAAEASPTGFFTPSAGRMEW